MIRKFLTSVAVAGLAAGAASALGLENNEPAAAPTNPYPVADSLDFTMTTETVSVGFGPSAGSFPTGNVLVFVDVTGGTFNAALSGVEVSGTTTSVISSGGLKGGTTVAFLVSGADMCVADTTAAGAETSCSLDIPLDLDGSDVSFSVGLETDAGAPVDNSAEDNRTSLTVIDTVPAFAVSIVADMVATTADLNAANGPFEDLVAGAGFDAVLGTITAGANAVSYDGGMTTDTVNSDFAGTDVSAANAGAITFTLTGEQDAFSTDATLMTAGDLVASTGTITENATTDVAAGTLVFGTLSSISVVADTNVAIDRSDYDVAVSIAAAAAGPIQQAAAGSGSLQSIDRNGTTIVFPWTQSATQGAASGTTSVYRFGNLDSIATGALFVEVKNASEAGYMNPGIIQISPSVAAGGEFVTNSTTLEGEVGNYGRGDLEFTAEADPDELTGRQFVVRNGVIQQVTGGTIEEDLQ